MLQRDWSPIETGGEQVLRVRRQQDGSHRGRKVSGDAAQEEEEAHNARGRRQQHGDAERHQANAENAQDRTVDPRFQGSHIAHQHNGNPGSADLYEEQLGAGLVQALSEKRFVVFDAQMGNQEKTGAKEKNTREGDEQQGSQAMCRLEHGVEVVV